MQVVGDPEMVPEAVREFSAILKRNDLAHPTRVERHAFYRAAADAFAIVQTGERRFYGNILLTKGVIPPDTAA
jgi:L-fucose mutarotase